MASLFISYARDDIRKVRALAEALERDGHDVWWDRHIAGGKQFSDEIERALEAASVVIVCWSERSVRSAWVRDEAASGRERNCLVPLTFDGCRPPLGFRQYQTVDLSGWDGRPGHAFDALAAAICGKLGELRHPTPARAPASHRLSPPDRLKWAGVAAVVAIITLAAFLYPRLTSAGAIEPKVAVGEFRLVSSGLPGSLPAMVGQEIVAAFGAENAVAVVAPGDRQAGASPYVMDGSISGLPDSVRFTVNLKNQRSGVVLWSNAYEHEAADIVAARQAAVGASQVIRCGLWGASSYETSMSDKALSLYLKWCNEHWSGSTNETSELDAARRVTVSLPDFSFGWSALALATVPLAARESPEAEELREEGRAAARKSMQLDSQNPEGYMALAGLLPLNRFAEREALLKKALSVRPTECGCERQAYGDFLASVGRMEEAVVEYERARDMRPLAPFSNVRFAQALYVVGRNEEADRVLQATLELWPNATTLRLLKIKSALWTGRFDQAVAELKVADLPLTSAKRKALADAFSALDPNNRSRRAQSLSELRRFAADPRQNDKVVVGTLAALGDRASALRAAGDLVRARGLFDADVLFEPNLAAASGDPAYAQLVSQLGLVTYWRSAPIGPDICRHSASPPFCSQA